MTVYITNAFSLAMLNITEAYVHIRKLTSSEASSFIISKIDEVVSAIGHESTAKLLTELLGVEIKVNRIQVQLNYGDYVLVFQIMTRLPEGKVLTLEELKQIPFSFYLVQIIALR